MFTIGPCALDHDIQDHQANDQSDRGADKAHGSAGHQAGAQSVLQDYIAHLRVAGADTREGAAGEYDHAGDKAAGNICLTVHFQSDGEHGKAHNKACNAAVGQNADGQRHSNHGRALAQLADDQSGDGLCAVGLFIDLSHQGACHENQEIASKKSGKAAHVAGL